jgi:hypothetical protein
MRIKWNPIQGNELEDAFDRGELKEVLPNCQAIYMWRRNLVLPKFILSDQSKLYEWIETSLNIPIAQIVNKELSHYATIESLTIGGLGLSNDKAETLKDMIKKPNNRKFLRDFLRSFGEMVPPLYVGETNTLVRRIKEHLNGDTGLKEVIVDALGLDWKDVDLWYLNLGPSAENTITSKNRRTLLEMMSTRFTIAGWVKRTG